jgi:hypothetical protein
VTDANAGYICEEIFQGTGPPSGIRLSLHHDTSRGKSFN